VPDPSILALAVPTPVATPTPVLQPLVTPPIAIAPDAPPVPSIVI